MAWSGRYVVPPPDPNWMSPAATQDQLVRQSTALYKPPVDVGGSAGVVACVQVWPSNVSACGVLDAEVTGPTAVHDVALKQLTA
jgi:hypothetical protein